MTSLYKLFSELFKTFVREKIHYTIKYKANNVGKIVSKKNSQKLQKI